MNTQRILTWAGFIVVIGLIVWGMIAAGNKAEREKANVGSVDEITATDWVTSSTSTPITIVEYSDFQCPACAAYFPVIEKLLEEYNGKVRLVYRHFPLPQHGNAVPASRAAEAAGKQGKFWEMYSMIFETQTEWETSKDVKTVFEGYAKTLGLDTAQFIADAASQAVMDEIEADTKSGLKAGVNSTPSFFINGKKINNPAGYEAFKQILDDALKTL